jgi:hypothetical protein
MRNNEDMDRRLKLILLIIMSLLLLGAVFWFVVWPLLKPVLPERSPQPPPLGQGEPQQGDVSIPAGASAGAQADGSRADQTFTFSPSGSNPDVQRILELSRRAGVLSELAESGSSENGFQNLAEAALDVSPALAAEFLRMQSELRERYNESGPAYLTIARRLVEIPESETRISDNTFDVRVQMQVETIDNGARSVEYRESTVTFLRQGSSWEADGYMSVAFTP